MEQQAQKPMKKKKVKKQKWELRTKVVTTEEIEPPNADKVTNDKKDLHEDPQEVQIQVRERGKQAMVYHDRSSKEDNQQLIMRS